MRVRRVVLVGLVVVLLTAVDGARAEETPRMGGVLKVATIGEPPTLDIAMSTAIRNSVPARNLRIPSIRTPPA